jgi:carboxylesterase type B
MIFSFSLSLLLCVIHSYCCATTTSSPLDVRLKTGVFRGVGTAAGLEKWLGIPYALPPVGPLRFKAPVPIARVSSTVRDASQFGNACPQPNVDLGAQISEDCLYLNVECLSL